MKAGQLSGLFHFRVKHRTFLSRPDTIERSNPMKITAIRATPINIPLETPFFWSVGLYPGTSKTIIEVETDEGLVGLGESPSWDCAEVINRHMAPC